MRAAYLDESGYTGTNLLDPAQPVYTVAAVILSEQEAADLKQRHFGSYRGAELKFTRLKRQPRHLSASNDLLEELLDRRVVKLSTADKRFVLVAKMFDLITEPLLHELGHDAYQDGFIADFASRVYLLLEQHEPTTLTAAMRAFIQLCHEPSEEHRRAYIKSLQAFSPEFQELLEPTLILPAQVLDLDMLRVDTLEGPLGIVLTCGLIAVLAARREVQDTPLHVIYDKSKIMQHGLPMWNWYLSADMPPQLIPMINGPVAFPINAVTQLEDSTAYLGLQIADVISGLVTMLISTQLMRQPLSDELKRTLDLLLAPKYSGSSHFHNVAASAIRQVPGDYGVFVESLTQTIMNDPNFPQITRQPTRQQQQKDDTENPPAREQTRGQEQ